MADDRHYATKGDLAAISGLGPPVYTVGPAGSSAVYNTVQEGVDAASLVVIAGTYARAVVLVAPGTYLQDVLCRCDMVDIVGQGGVGSVVIRSITISNATAASVTLFNASGLYADLVNDAALTNPPLANVVQNVTCSRDAAAGAWVGEARASLRLLGAPVAAGTFQSTGANVSACILAAASGAAAGTGGLVISQANVVTVDGSNITGGVVLDQCAQVDFVNTKIEDTGSVKSGYNSAGTIPVTAHVGVSFTDSMVESELELNGDTSATSGMAAYFGTIDVNTTAVGSASDFGDCHCKGTLDLGAVGPTVTWGGGEVVLQPTGAGVAGFTQTVRRVACDTVPGTDNTRDVGSTALAFAEVHGRSVQAHADAIDAIKSALTTSALTATGNNFAVSAAAAANDAPGYSETVRGGAGGAAVAAPGGLGGVAVLEGGAGGAGSIAQAAGGGGGVTIVAGAAGAALAGGGANGGAVAIDAGALSGYGTDGSITIGTTTGAAVGVSKAGVTTTINGALTVAETANLNGDVNLGNAATDTVTVTGQVDSDVACVKQVARTVNIATSDANTIGAALTVAAAAGGVTAGAGVAGAGGGITVSSGAGGATSGAGNGGAGGTAALASGAGGAAGAAAGVGGAGGPASIAAGTGGAGTATGVAGAGGSITIAAGSAGAAGAYGGANGGSIDIDAGAGTGAGTKGTIKIGGTHVSAIEIGNVVDNPTVQILSTGLLTHRGSISPNADNSLALGTTVLAYLSAHARLVEAHADNLDTAKASLAATTLTIKGNGFTVGFVAPAADVAASALASAGCAGGASGAGIGQTGGANSVTAGIGGAGSAGFAAGGGGQLNLAAGAAGAAAAGGGAVGGITNIDGGAGTGAFAGGAVTIDGGAAPGAGAGGAVQLTGGTSAAGTAGKVQLQAAGSGTTEIGNVGDSPAAAFLGTGTVSVGGDIDCAGRVMGRQAVVIPGPYPYTVLPDDQVITATSGGVVVDCDLPLAVAGNVGETHTVVKIDAGAGSVDVDPQDVDRINGNGVGVAYNLAAQWNAVTLVCAAAGQWVIVNTQ